MSPADQPNRPGAWHRVPAGWRLAATAFGVLVLFTAIGLGTTSTSSRTASAHPGLARTEATVITIFLGWLVVVAVALAIWALTAKGGPPSPGRSFNPTNPWLRRIMLLATVAIVLWVARSVSHGANRPPSLPPIRPPQGQQTQPKPGRGLVDPTVVTWGLVAALALTALAVYLVARWERRRRGQAAQLHGSVGEDAADLLVQAIDEALDDLEAEPDPRRAVIAAYARMEQTLRRSGLPRRPWEAPTEYLDRVLRALGGAAPAVDRLTALFEVARFSDHPVGPEMKRDAIAALTELRSGLAVPA